MMRQDGTEPCRLPVPYRWVWRHRWLRGGMIRCIATSLAASANAAAGLGRRAGWGGLRGIVFFFEP